MDWLDDAPKKKTQEFPRMLDGLSIEELDAYVAALNAEILRVQANRATKEKARTSADAVFGAKA